MVNVWVVNVLQSLFSMQRGAERGVNAVEREMSMLCCAKSVVKMCQHILEKQDEMLIREE